MDSYVLDLLLPNGECGALKYIAFGFMLGCVTTFLSLHLRSSLSATKSADDKFKEYEAWNHRVSSITGNSETGIVFAKGSGLKIIRMDDNMAKMLGFSRNQIPDSVHSLIPPGLRDAHKSWLRNAVSSTQLPGNLVHPLRNVEVLSHSEKKIKVNVSIGILNKDDAVSDECIFFAMISPVGGGTERDIMNEKNWRGAIAHMYGVNVAQIVANGDLPTQESYDKATVLFLDICNFTRSCMERDADEVAEWMRQVHNEVEAAIHRHHIRKIETRGDCYVCVTGTNALANDAHHNQVERMLEFARDTSMALRNAFDTEIRVGISTGPVTISFIKTHQFAPTMCIFGDTVCTAARMEQSGAPGHVHLCKLAAERYAHESHLPVPPLHRTEVKSKGVVPTAFFSCQRARFLLLGEKVDGVVTRQYARSDSVEPGPSAPMFELEPLDDAGAMSMPTRPPTRPSSSDGGFSRTSSLGFRRNSTMTSCY